MSIIYKYYFEVIDKLAYLIENAMTVSIAIFTDLSSSFIVISLSITVLKGNEMRNRRGSNARKSIASADEMKNKSNRGNNNATGGGDGKEKPLGMRNVFCSLFIVSIWVVSASSNLQLKF